MSSQQGHATGAIAADMIETALQRHESEPRAGTSQPPPEIGVFFAPCLVEAARLFRELAAMGNAEGRGNMLHEKQLPHEARVPTWRVPIVEAPTASLSEPLAIG
jgi:hypothetical protein